MANNNNKNQMSSSSSSSSSKQIMFPNKVFQMLNDATMEGSESIVSWMPKMILSPEQKKKNKGNGIGTSIDIDDDGVYDKVVNNDSNNVIIVHPFRVHKPKEFEEKIMSRYFRGSNKYRSFTRSLNLWCFERIAQNGPYKNAYYNILFRKDQPSLCSRMSRIKIKNNVVKQEDEQQPILLFPNSLSLSPSSSPSSSSQQWFSHDDESLSRKLSPLATIMMQKKKKSKMNDTTTTASSSGYCLWESEQDMMRMQGLLFDLEPSDVFAEETKIPVSSSSSSSPSSSSLAEAIASSVAAAATVYQERNVVVQPEIIDPTMFLSKDDDPFSPRPISYETEAALILAASKKKKRRDATSAAAAAAASAAAVMIGEESSLAGFIINTSKKNVIAAATTSDMNGKESFGGWHNQKQNGGLRRFVSS